MKLSKLFSVRGIVLMLAIIAAYQTYIGLTAVENFKSMLSQRVAETTLINISK
jgi:hypothetical protein